MKDDQATASPEVAIEETQDFRPRFNEAGLLPCITQDAESGDVLMMAWMNREAIDLTLATGEVHYFSRSRNSLWKKGETSGAIQKLIELRIDCDQDCLLARVAVADRARTCHTGRTGCFYRTAEATPEGLRLRIRD
ncbi:phosphoribosyl-AMP cyclohydrolase [Afifella sp. JA880]|uniref:phosphoribosyl-AMP cyclohydrolase n=1 Tax=Afifella sp. JA880 TaxID=2975280 RepID=UPI0021BB38CD|nr:phosphoribosyl-AMP cyclohydrolase [Afifella sp. JA880]MCT8267276.1 phosphoribosyl-AMP cyclohydrolase [Afifella sp. JA880]